MAKATPGFIGPYRLLNIVNTGQTSRIWQAYDDAAHEICGIKVLLEDFQRNREHIGYLRQEFVVGENLKHKHIIQINDFASDRGIYYLAMEWFPAPNMKHLIRHEFEQTQHKVPDLVEQMGESLAYLNEHGWVHRDIKPDNYLVSAAGKVKLIDFALTQKTKGGIAKLLNPKSKIQGTRSYMSPEQIRGGALDSRSDLYSLGCTIFELLSGKPPFTGSSGNELLMKHLRSSPPTLESANRNVTPEFGDLIRQTMAKKPGNRPKSVTDFLTQFRMVQIFKRAPKPPEQTEKADS
ncbi:MAG: serine/threonine-protein kinase [Planctomycetota bacterium]|nr:serine/threonine-protein kinase [Planctomycetota bacterium]